MANLEIIVPDDLHERLCRIAGAYDGAVADFALAVIRREVECWRSACRCIAPKRYTVAKCAD